MQTRKKNSNEFETIYLKANDRNRRGLETELKAHACIDVTDNVGVFTPAAKLAAKGKHDSVALLLELGASESQVAMGYASAGDVERAEEIRKTHPINIELLAAGSAMHHDTTYAELLRTKYSLNPAWFVFGAAFSGNIEYAKKLLNSLVPTKTTLVKKQYEIATCMYIKGLILGGHIDEAVAILDQYRNQESSLYLKEAIEAAGRAGLLFHVGETETSQDEQKAFLYRNGHQPHILEEYRLRAAIGAAKGGHLDLACNLFAKTNPRKEAQETIIHAAMRHGHITSVLQHFPCPEALTLRDDRFLQHPLTLKAAVLGNHSDIYSKIVQKRPNAMLVTLSAERGDLETAADLAALTQVDFRDILRRMDSDKYFQSEAVLLFTLTMMQNAGNFIERLANAAFEMKSDEQMRFAVNSSYAHKVFQRDFFYSFKDLNQRAKKIRATMDRLDLNYDQAKAYIEMTVRITPRIITQLLKYKQQYGSSPLLTALMQNSGAKLKSETKESTFAKAAELLPFLIGAFVDAETGKISALDNIRFSDEEDLYSDDVTAFAFKLHDLIAKMAFNGFEPSSISRDLALLTGLTENDAGELYERFCRKVYKAHIETKLTAYINYNNEASLFSNPVSRLWEVVRRPVDMVKTSHSARAQSILEELDCPSDKTMPEHTRASMQGIFTTTKMQFEKKSQLPPTADGPKWKQPLTNQYREEFYEISDELSNSRLTK